VAARWPAGGPDAAHRRLVAEIVRRGVQCVLPDAPVSVVARLMRCSGADAVPVIGTAGDLLGLVTATDLVAVLAGEFGPDAGSTDAGGPEAGSPDAGSRTRGSPPGPADSPLRRRVRSLQNRRPE